MAGKHPKRKDRPGVDRLGRTELHYAAVEGDIMKARRLIGAGAQIDLADDNGWASLHFAAQSQHRYNFARNNFEILSHLSDV